MTATRRRRHHLRTLLPLVRRTQVYADLLPSSGKVESGLTPEELLQEVKEAWASRTKTQLFRSPLISYLYERGWRQGFERAGFPGIDVEFEEVRTFFAGAEGGAGGDGAEGDVVVDMSCGSGLMTRRLATCDYGRLLALDYSESMLAETRRRLRGKPGQGAGENDDGARLVTPELLRADVAALPLRSGAVAAVHAGAAMHCWPQLELGLREIRRVLRPGGRFYATTFFQASLTLSPTFYTNFLPAPAPAPAQAQAQALPLTLTLTIISSTATTTLHHHLSGCLRCAHGG